MTYISPPKLPPDRRLPSPPLLMPLATETEVPSIPSEPMTQLLALQPIRVFVNKTPGLDLQATVEEVN